METPVWNNKTWTKEKPTEPGWYKYTLHEFFEDENALVIYISDEACLNINETLPGDGLWRRCSRDSLPTY